MCATVALYCTHSIFFHFPWLTGGHVVSLFQDAVMTCYYVLQRKCCPHTGLMNIQRLALVEPRPQQPKRCFSSNNADGINDQVRLQRHIATVSSPFVTRRQVNTRISVGHYVKTLRFLTWIFFLVLSIFLEMKLFRDSWLIWVAQVAKFIHLNHGHVDSQNYVNTLRLTELNSSEIFSEKVRNVSSGK